MIKLHHLNKSRSQRIIWLLEELGQDYQVVPYQRDASSNLAPPELTAIHPLGKSPVIEDGELIIAESGAITEHLIEKYAADRFAPQHDTDDFAHYLQWIHFAESSAILPLLLKMFVGKDGAKMNFLDGYAENETQKVISYFNAELEGKTYLVADRLSGADFMMSFIVEILENTGAIKHFSNIEAYAKQLRTHAGFNRARELEKEYDESLT